MPRGALLAGDFQSAERPNFIVVTPRRPVKFCGRAPAQANRRRSGSNPPSRTGPAEKPISPAYLTGEAGITSTACAVDDSLGPPATLAGSRRRMPAIWPNFVGRPVVRILATAFWRPYYSAVLFDRGVPPLPLFLGSGPAKVRGD